jgi:hypothetical protein
MTAASQKLWEIIIFTVDVIYAVVKNVTNRFYSNNVFRRVKPIINIFRNTKKLAVHSLSLSLMEQLTP